MDNENKATEGVDTTNSTETTDQTKTYTQEEVDALLQKEADRRVTAALKKQENKIKEAEKVARMNEEEKYRYELEQREAAIEAKERELALAEMKNEASKILSEKGISLQLVDFVVNEDAEMTKANIDILDKAFKASVKAEVEKRLGSNAPKKNLPLDDVMTQEKFNKLSVSEMNKLYQENPEIFNQFNK